MGDPAARFGAPSSLPRRRAGKDAPRRRYQLWGYGFSADLGIAWQLGAGVSLVILLTVVLPSTLSPMIALTDQTFRPIIPFVFLANGLFTSVLAAVFLGLDRRQRPPPQESETGELRRAA